MSKQQLYESIANFKKHIKISEYAYPLNIFEICDKISRIEIGPTPFKTNDIRGIAYVAANKNENNVILVNANKTKSEINYYGTHELMHIAIQRNTAGQTFKCYECVRPNQDSFIEWQANEGAAEFLVPYKVLLPLIKRNYKKMCEGIGTYEFCQNFAEAFRVTSRVMKIRLESLSYEIEQYLSGVSIDDIEILSKRKQKDRGLDITPLTVQEDVRLLLSGQAMANL